MSERETEMCSCMPKEPEALKACLHLTCGVHKWVLNDIFKVCEDKELLPSGKMT